MTEARDRRRASYRVLLATLWLTLLVLAVKVWAGWATRSLSLLAESLHTLIDCFSTVLSLVAVASPYRIAGREVWSHGRRVTAGALLLVAFVGFTGFSLLGMSVQQLQAATQNLPLPFSVEVSLPLVQLLGIVVAINICLVLFERYEARILESPALRLNANHMLKHAWLTILVLVGLVGVSLGYIWLDPLMTIGLVVISIKSCWRVFNLQLPLLVQQTAIAPEALAHIASQIEGITRCYQVRSQGLVGRQVFVEMRIVLHPEFLNSVRLIAERVEGAIRERYGPVQVQVHVDGIAGEIEQQPIDPMTASQLRSKRSNSNWN